MTKYLELSCIKEQTNLKIKSIISVVLDAELIKLGHHFSSLKLNRLSQIRTKDSEKL